MSSEPLHDEPTLRIDADSVTIRRYYFPIGRAKVIPRDQIRSVNVRPTTWATRWRLWGSTNLRNWLPLELGRYRKQRLIEIDIGSRVRPTVTPDDPDRVARLLNS